MSGGEGKQPIVDVNHLLLHEVKKLLVLKLELKNLQTIDFKKKKGC